ncbi:fas apoptotic inhibitory molecule 3 isoform X1 [Lepus europaeus]|uniref:fas apoptotic inhibitory molecule 3 isoform X1 n=1 Tax=Lepus europaeus TaxID=9983 RepID=UPI002B48E108|nr:fas apoptotic inhibitory molecule 3 isoform X1 [Lepus europaeus]
MDFRLWLLCFLPVAGALRPLPEVQLEAELGGSVTIKCPLPEVEGRMYLCRQMAESRSCATVVSNHYTKDEYKSRVTLTQRSEKHQFLVRMTELTERDSGIYACGVGINTDHGKTKKVALNVHSAFSRRVRRLAVRMRARDATRRPRAQRSRTSSRPRSQNVYSACPRRAQGPDAAGAPDAPRAEPAASAPPTPPQVSETPWPQAATLQTSCEYVTICHQPAAKMEDPDSDNYVNIPYLTHLPSCAPGPGAWC